MGGHMKKNTKKQLFNILIVICLAFFTWLALSKSNKELNYDNLLTFIKTCNPIYILLAFGCWALFVLFEALSLHIILKKLGYKIKARSSIAYSTSDIYYSALTPSASGGQPASAYYMVKDGIPGGVSGIALIFNIIGYTAATLIIGLIAIIAKFDLFLEMTTFTQFLVIFGLVSQIILLTLFIMCMRWHTMVLKLSKTIISLLNKLKIIKNKEKWVAKAERAVDKYHSCYEDLKANKSSFIWVLLCNIAQRASQIMISVFVCESIIKVGFFDLFILQSFVVIGYNSLPLPGGVGAYEFLFLGIYGLQFESSLIAIIMMVTRIISYYFSIVAAGLYTITYHIIQHRKRSFIDYIKEKRALRVLKKKKDIEIKGEIYNEC
jgi:uncharacterized protein (TIRG00374 family)